SLPEGFTSPNRTRGKGITTFHPQATHTGWLEPRLPFFRHNHATADEYDDGIGVNASDPLDQFDLGRFEGKTYTISTFRVVRAGHLSTKFG
ncbi:MAG: hypothetical protein IPK19_24390, partial [Chloroflexi bacterium]|nr:hypothetical protein [Chloroflexota bacterium]